MSIFKTEVPKDIVTSHDQVVRSSMEMNHDSKITYERVTKDMGVTNLAKGAVRRKSNGD